MSNLICTCTDLTATAKVGEELARAVQKMAPRAILFSGDLGAGKTTLIASLVRTLPNGHAAQIGSPSFTLCNIYPTQPIVHHYDLYRQKAQMHNDSLAEDLDTPSLLCLIEWPEHMHPDDAPHDGIHCHIQVDHPTQRRTLCLTALGELGRTFLAYLTQTSVYFYYDKGNML